MILGGEHEGYFPENSEAIDFFAPGREDFLTEAPPFTWHVSEPRFRQSSVVPSLPRGTALLAPKRGLAISARPPITWVTRLTGATGAT